MYLNDIIRANERSHSLSEGVHVCVCVCLHEPSHADLGTHKHHMTRGDKWWMAHSTTPDVTIRTSGWWN